MRLANVTGEMSRRVVKFHNDGVVRRYNVRLSHYVDKFHVGSVIECVLERKNLLSA